MTLYAQTSGNQSTNSGSFVPIPGLSLTIPEGVGTAALVILNLPRPYATGNNNPGGNFGVSVDPAQRRPGTDHTGGQHTAGKQGASHRGGVVGSPRQHRPHRQPGDAQRDPRLKSDR
jgi:hypothetical protein